MIILALLQDSEPFECRELLVFININIYNINLINLYIFIVQDRICHIVDVQCMFAEWVNKKINQ